jgi:hypothetical protein
MNYQLVLQFRNDSLDDFDAMVALEGELIETLSDAAKVDGHDVGSGETNIFILTSDPEATFSLTKPVLGVPNICQRLRLPAARQMATDIR